MNLITLCNVGVLSTEKKEKKLSQATPWWLYSKKKKKTNINKAAGLSEKLVQIYVTPSPGQRH